ALSRGVAARDGTVLDLDAGAAEVARRLGLATRSGLAVAVEGASWTWPTVLDGVQPGDAAMIYAGFDGGATPAKVAVTIGTDRRELAVEPAAAPLVHRAVVAAEIALYEAGLGAIEDPAARAAAVDQIVDLSTRYRVLSDHTALLVLETEADYQRFGIDRNALSGILVAGDRGVEIMSRDVPVFLGGAAPPSRDAPDKPELALEQNRLAQELDSRGDDGEPPPEEPAVADDDGSEESGGTGTAMALDEGRMGKKESDRAEGQYKMKKRDDDVATGSSGPAGAPSIDQPRSAPVADPYMEPPPPPPPPPRHEIQQPPPVDDVRTDKEGRPVPYAGRMAKVMDLLAAHKLDAALAEARRWRAEAPGDVLALIALGEAYEARGDAAQAARVYGSIIDLFPARADLRRFAGERLDRLAGVDGAAGDGARALAVDTYQRAVAQRPDHLTGHRLLAYALVRAGRLADAFAAIETGLAQTYPPDRFAEGDRILREDLGLIGAAWLRADAKAKPEIERRLAAASATLATGRSLRFVLVWETDANDVDFHIHDARGGHAFYSQRELASGGELYADVTTGYGPECFTIPGTPKAAPYRLSIHYYSRGPMGYGMGKLQVLRHDGKGTLTFEDRPFVVMNDQAFVELGSVK
ncbi:MAG: hypothetical protein KC464_28445, partial [Myxococcales bacterium]|nr:hypothetical protein [Myxococcales bacterium]